MDSISERLQEYAMVHGKWKSSGLIMKGRSVPLKSSAASSTPPTDCNRLPSIKQVIFHDPATIIYWTDGTRTVVKCQDGDVYDPEKGLAMAISKKALGNKVNYHNVFKQWLPEEEVETLDQRIIDAANKIVQRAFEEWQREHSEGRNNHGRDSAM